jgi:hypothetical protein
MGVDEIVYTLCMLIIYVVRNIGKISFDEKIYILQYLSNLSRSFELTLCKINNCDNNAMVEYKAE